MTGPIVTPEGACRQVLAARNRRVFTHRGAGEGTSARLTAALAAGGALLRLAAAAALAALLAPLARGVRGVGDRGGALLAHALLAQALVLLVALDARAVIFCHRNLRCRGRAADTQVNPRSDGSRRAPASAGP